MRGKHLKTVVLLIAICVVISGCYENDIQDNQEITGGIFALADGDRESIAKLEPVLRQIDDWVDKGDIVGAEMLVIENKEIIIHKSFGWLDREAEIPMKNNTIFRIRSMTKPFIATGALILIEEGKMSLSDPVAKYLASFNNEASQGITIEHLLTHTGGFSQPGYVKDYELYSSLREAADDIGSRGPDFAPGTRYVYSDAGVAVLGAVVAEVSGMPVEEYIENTILQPLQMDDTFCNLVEDKEVLERIAATYAKHDGKYVKYWDSSQPQAVEYFRASGGMYSTPLDYAKFLYMWMNNGQVGSQRYLSEQSVVEALSPSSMNSHYGYLWETGEYFGHGGSDGTIAFALPEQNIMVLYFTQSRHTHTTEMVKAMVSKQLSDDPADQYPRIDLASERYNDYTGQYRHPHVVIEISTDGTVLYVSTPDASNQAFYSTAVDFFAHELLDIQLSFSRNNAGEVFSVTVHQKGENLEAIKME